MYFEVLSELKPGVYRVIAAQKARSIRDLSGQIDWSRQAEALGLTEEGPQEDEGEREPINRDDQGTQKTRHAHTRKVQ